MSPRTPDGRSAARAAREGAEDAAARADLDRIWQHIVSRAPEHEINPSLDRVQRVMEILGDPHRAFRAIHVTGTNGKTSTARMAERLVREHGLRTGLFTSPHLTSVTERIQVDGEPISAQRFVDTWNDVHPYVQIVDAELAEQGRAPLSFFEVLVVLAYAAFADAPVDVAVVEVGMGGEWDSTNVIDAEVAVIAPVAMDHQQWLGHTLEEIARTKAGIVKDGATVVVAEQTPEADEVIAEVAAARGAHVLREGAELAVVERAPAVGGQVMALRTPAAVYADVYLPLYGAHQAHNALLALGAAEALLSGGRALDGGLVEAAFTGVTSPGRLEVVRSSPTVLVDAAHNPAGAEALVAALDESFAFERLVGVVGVLGDKDAEGLLAVLEPVLAEVVITRSSSPRSTEPEDLAEIARDVFGEDRVHVVERLADAITTAADLVEPYDAVGGGQGVGVLVTGSVILAADARVVLGRG
ncbi:bifunctional folylpolyglutamate synthase/dihydrofolate synthase [Luteimicrobium subarcticum]|uniref:tetrahydrofolate synthase n=1 Tax=Luteimicrobium subarcticum TaxID=620910 RepID=A0A2M8WU45_9MICO|nr:folylpolyglutamate synthase/dihydrofolate synthase family protein [Luteimicrobium subarcticum]PJI94453.1 dihydrofolate synthase/folylpolyglutamate synthase [Luteimicrobium subarcticum]